MASLNTGQMNERYIQHVSNIRLQIEATQISPDDGFDCSTESYDICLSRERLLLNSSCTLPFEDTISSQDEICTNYEQGMDTVRDILATRENCQQMCLQMNIRYSQEPENYLLALTRPKVIREFSNQDFGYHYIIPKDVRLLSNKHDYTAPIALGYFGSIVGIFTGISILSFLILFTETKYFSASIRKGFLLTLQAGIIIYLAVVVIMLFCKFLQYSSTYSINFIQTKTDFSISVCSKPFTYELSYGRFSPRKPKDRLKDVTFWKNWLNISTMIDSVVINNGSHEVDLNLDDDALDIKFFILPIDNNSIAVCNTIDLTPYGMIEIMDLYYKTEIEMYLHRNGQFFYEWNRKQNMISGSSYQNVEKKHKFTLLFDFTAFIKAELKSSLGHPSEYFDDCVTAKMNENIDTEMMKCFFTRSYVNDCQTIRNRSSLNLINTILHETECRTPSTFLNTKATIVNEFSKHYIKTDIQSTNVDFFIETTKSTNPKITLRFSDITKLTQVKCLKEEDLLYRATQV